MDRFEVLYTTSAQQSNTLVELVEVVQSEPQTVEHVGLVSIHPSQRFVTPNSIAELTDRKVFKSPNRLRPPVAIEFLKALDMRYYGLLQSRNVYLYSWLSSK